MWHPVQVESVAWISDRKDLLASFFALGSAIAWFRWNDAPVRRARYIWMGVTLLLFTAALLSKILTVFVPAAILIAELSLRPVAEWRRSLPRLLSRLALFGALNIRTGAWHYQVRRRMKKEDFIAFLEELLTVYPTQLILVIVDNYSSHTAHDVADWLATHPRMQLHFLPKYCSHLNPVEPIWLQMKGQIAANRLYGSIKLVLQAVDTFFARMTPAQALTWAGAEK